MHLKHVLHTKRPGSAVVCNLLTVRWWWWLWFLSLFLALFYWHKSTVFFFFFTCMEWNSCISVAWLFIEHKFTHITISVYLCLRVSFHVFIWDRLLTFFDSYLYVCLTETIWNIKLCTLQSSPNFSRSPALYFNISLSFHFVFFSFSFTRQQSLYV